MLLEGFSTIAMIIGKKKDDHGVITITDLDTPKKPVGRFMVNQQIGSLHVLLLTKKVMAIWSQLMGTPHHLNLVFPAKNN